MVFYSTVIELDRARLRRYLKKTELMMIKGVMYLFISLRFVIFGSDRDSVNRYTVTVCHGIVPGRDEVKQVPNYEGRYTSQHGIL